MSATINRAAKIVKEWNKNYRPGQTVWYKGKQCKTFSCAGLGVGDRRETPVIFLEDREYPVLLKNVTIEKPVIKTKDSQQTPTLYEGEDDGAIDASGQ